MFSTCPPFKLSGLMQSASGDGKLNLLFGVKRLKFTKLRLPYIEFTHSSFK